MAVKTNILGTENILEAAISCRVKRVVCLSTDKAVHPINAMGISKAMMEKVFVAKSRTTDSTIICGTRYGNVMASRGSVIPLFLDQISRGGPVTVTDKNVTRYFMTIPEAANLVLQASDMAQGGEVFILDMGEQLNIMDLAKRLIDEALEGGAQAIKFQTYKADTIASKDSPYYWDISKEPTRSQHELFKKYDEMK